MALDERIHRAVYARRAQRPAREDARQYYVLALRIWMIALDRAQELEEAVEAHRDLLEAIRVGDGDRAADIDARPRRELRAGDASRAPDV